MWVSVTNCLVYHVRIFAPLRVRVRPAIRHTFVSAQVRDGTVAHTHCAHLENDFSLHRSVPGKPLLRDIAPHDVIIALHANRLTLTKTPRLLRLRHASVRHVYRFALYIAFTLFNLIRLNIPLR